MTILSAWPAAVRISGCALFDENDPNRGACIPASKWSALVGNHRLCRAEGCKSAPHRWRRSCQDTRFARSKSLVSLSGGRRSRRRFRGLASRAAASDGKTRHRRGCRQKAVGVGQFLAQRSRFPAGRFCRGTARLPSREVASTAGQHLNKRSRSTGRSRHATVSSPKMSRVNFNVPSYANSSKSCLVTTRRPALCRSPRRHCGSRRRQSQ